MVALTTTSPRWIRRRAESQIAPTHSAKRVRKPHVHFFADSGITRAFCGPSLIRNFPERWLRCSLANVAHGDASSSPPLSGAKTETGQLQARWRGNPHDELSHAKKTESRSRNHFAADFRTSKESGSKSLLLPLLSLLPLSPVVRGLQSDCRTDTRPRLSVRQLILDLYFRPI